MDMNKRYFFLKLKEGFYEQKEIVVLEGMNNGILYSNILMKMYLASLKHEGFLMINGQLAMTPEMIAILTRHETGTVERALKAFMELGLVEVTETGTFYMSQIETMIGKSSTEAERKAAARSRIAAGRREALLEQDTGDGADKGRTNVRKVSAGCPQGVRKGTDICPTEYRDKSLESISQRLELEREEGETTAVQPKKAFGSRANVFLTAGELAALKEDYPADYTGMIEHLSEYMDSTGKNYRDHAATMRRWKREDEKRNKGSRENTGGYAYNADYGEGESL